MFYPSCKKVALLGEFMIWAACCKYSRNFWAVLRAWQCLQICLLLAVPFTDPEQAAAYHAEYQKHLRVGARKREPRTLEAALEELRQLRVTIQKQRKRIWFLEHKEDLAAKQRAGRRAGYASEARRTINLITIEPQ